MKADLERWCYQLRIDAKVEIVELSDSSISAYTYEKTLLMEDRKEYMRQLRLNTKEKQTQAQLIMDKSRSGEQLEPPQGSTISRRSSKPASKKLTSGVAETDTHDVRRASGSYVRRLSNALFRGRRSSVCGAPESQIMRHHHRHDHIVRPPQLRSFDPNDDTDSTVDLDNRRPSASRPPAYGTSTKFQRARSPDSVFEPSLKAEESKLVEKSLTADSTTRKDDQSPLLTPDIVPEEKQVQTKTFQTVHVPPTKGSDAENKIHRLPAGGKRPSILPTTSSASKQSSTQTCATQSSQPTSRRDDKDRAMDVPTNEPFENDNLRVHYTFTPQTLRNELRRAVMTGKVDTMLPSKLSRELHQSLDADAVKKMHTAVSLNRVIRDKSAQSQLVVLNLPRPPKSRGAFYNYLEYMEVLTQGLDRVLLVRGTGKEVITIYS